MSSPNHKKVTNLNKLIGVQTDDANIVKNIAASQDAIDQII